MRRPLLAACVLLLAVAVPAPAQEGQETVVARSGTTEMTFHAARGTACVGLRTRGEGGTVECGEVPLGRLDAQLATRGTFVAGAVPAGTASVEVEYADGGRVRANTTTGSAYRGRYAGKLVFFIVDAAAAHPGPDEQPMLVRRFDAAGALIGAAGDGYDAGHVGAPVTLLRKGPTHVTAVATRGFAPSILQLDRVESRVCLAVEHGRGSGETACQITGPGPIALQLQPQPQCGRRGTIIHGFAGPDTSTVRLTLGSGRSIRVATTDISVLGTAARGVAVEVPPGEAVRHAQAFDRNGRRLGEQSIAAPPSARRCDTGITAGLFLFGAAYAFDQSRPAAPPEGHQVAMQGALGSRLVLRDEADDYLCLGVDTLAADRGDCIVPSPEPYFPDFDEAATPQRSAAAGIVPPGAAAVRVVFAGREPVTAAIGEGGEYGGRYRGHLRFFLAEVTGRHEVEAVETVGANGELLTRLPGSRLDDPPVRTFARRRGVRIFGVRSTFRVKFPGRRLETHRSSCFGFALPGEPASHELCSFSPGGLTMTGRVSCSPRTGAVMGAVTKRLRGVRLVLAGGGVIASQAVRVPRSLGGGRLWLARIPAGARVTRVRVLGRLPRAPRRRSFAYDVADPAHQCGYVLDPTF